MKVVKLTGVENSIEFENIRVKVDSNVERENVRVKIDTKLKRKDPQNISKTLEQKIEPISESFSEPLSEEIVQPFKRNMRPKLNINFLTNCTKLISPGGPYLKWLLFFESKNFIRLFKH